MGIQRTFSAIGVEVISPAITGQRYGTVDIGRTHKVVGLCGCQVCARTAAAQAQIQPVLQPQGGQLAL